MYAPRWRAPPRIISSCSSGHKTSHADERRFYKIESNGRRITFRPRGIDYDGSVCAFAVKPRAFGAPHAASGLDRSAQPSKGVAVAAMQPRDVRDDFLLTPIGPIQGFQPPATVM
jgi:hypothetical protein